MHKETLQGKAYAFTLLALLWTPFSGFGVFDWLDMRRRLSLDMNTLPDLMVWGLHGLFIGLARHFWHTERPQPTLCISEDFWTHVGVHACGWILFANIPLLAWWHGSVAIQIVVHGTLLLMGIGGVGLLRRAQSDAADMEQ